jgi:hypothetical protein
MNAASLCHLRSFGVVASWDGLTGCNEEASGLIPLRHTVFSTICDRPVAAYRPVGPSHIVHGAGADWSR